jgi:hypothetical protein
LSSVSGPKNPRTMSGRLHGELGSLTAQAAFSAAANPGYGLCCTMPSLIERYVPAFDFSSGVV